ncbi:MAG: DUF3570 domain-containing protein [Chitinophagales bacterium]
MNLATILCDKARTLKSFYTLIVVVLLASQTSMGQSTPDPTIDNSSTQIDAPTKQLEEAEMNILFSYYSQDGNHSPVTGGIGTESLQDYTSTIIVNLPLNEKSKMDITAGFDFYSSASTDNIDTRISSASSSDSRIYFNVGYSRLVPDKNKSFGVMIGGSREYDVTSLQGGLNFSKASKDNNREISLAAQAFFDTWDLIYPIELRNQGALLNTNIRQSYNLSATYSQVINKRMQIAFNPEVTYQTGLLSTPFHRVYFLEQQQAKIEQLPDTRLKIPLGLRINYYLSDKILLRSYYRYYSDDWGITGHTASLEIPFKINRFFSIYPHYRYYTQTAADYFKPYKEHSLSDTFYTSDYDLSAFSSQQYGVGVHYSPLNGIGRMKMLKLGKKPANILLFKSIDLRGTLYDRSDGLKAWLISLDMGFTF